MILVAGATAPSAAMADHSQAGPPRSSESPAQPVARTKHGELTLDQIGALMPGLGELMPIISDRFAWMYHAGRGGNWDLARYQLRKVRHLFRVGKTTRPKWIETIDSYDGGFLERIAAAIEARSWEDFERAAQRAVDEANRIHSEIGYGYIVYRVPAEPPDHIQVESTEGSNDG